MPTALLSAYDKTGIVDLARGLHDLGWSIVSSGGTARAIAEAGVEVTDVAELTGLSVPAVKTRLHRARTAVRTAMGVRLPALRGDESRDGAPAAA